MAKFKLAFGIHNHQPVGNFEAVFEWHTQVQDGQIGTVLLRKTFSLYTIGRLQNLEPRILEATTNSIQIILVVIGYQYFRWIHNRPPL